MPREIVALGLDRSRSSLWVAMGQELRIYDLEGAVSKTVILDQKDSVNDLAYDRALDKVWINFPDRLRRYDELGKSVFEITGDFSGAIAPDGTGGLWLARNREVSHLDEFGARTFRTEPFAGEPDKSIVDLVADPADASIWVASQKHIRHYAIDGELVGQLTPELGDGVIRRLRRASLYADLDPPEINITAPAPGSLLNNNRPTIELHYFDLGVGVDPDTVKIEIDGEPLAVSCSLGTSTASCIPDTVLPEGEVQIGATVADFVGNIADPAEIRVVIDTIPPEITITQPQPGHITNQRALSIRGLVSEPAALTINQTAVSLSPVLDFVFETQLVEGGNAIELSATDRAGNRSAKTLDVMLDTVPPALPSAGLISVGESNGGQVSVAGAAGSVEPASTVRITNIRSGKTVTATAASDGSFHAVIEAEPGDELSIVAIDAAANSSGAVVSRVPAALGVMITEPADGATIETDSVLVMGNFKGPLNTAIIVNGKPATIISEAENLKFYVTVPLNAGQNVLTATATLQSGNTLTRTITVNRVSGAFTVKITRQDGVLPQAVGFSVTGDFIRFDQARLDFNGDGQVDASGGGVFFGFSRSYTYNAPGIYRPKVEVYRYNFSVGRYELIYQQTLAIAIFDPVQLKQHLDQVLRSVWSGMNSALLAGDIPRALSALSFDSREVFGEVFESLIFRMPAILDEFTQIEPLALSDTYADYVVMNVRDGKTRVHVINFIQGADGVWRIDSM